MGSRSADARRAAHEDGLRAEALVARRLVSAGWNLVARNWVGAGGELDVVVVRDGRLRFVEVKARAPGDLDGLDAIGPGKRRRLVQAARAFLDQWTEPVQEACFTVALVHLPDAPAGLDQARVEWLDDAFDA